MNIDTQFRHEEAAALSNAEGVSNDAATTDKSDQDLEISNAAADELAANASHSGTLRLRAQRDALVRLWWLAGYTAPEISKALDIPLGRLHGILQGQGLTRYNRLDAALGTDSARKERFRTALVEWGQQLDIFQIEFDATRTQGEQKLIEIVCFKLLEAFDAGFQRGWDQA